MLRFDPNLSLEAYSAWWREYPNIYASPKWPDIKSEWTVKRCGLYDGDTLVLAAQILVRPLLLGKSLWYLPKSLLWAPDVMRPLEIDAVKAQQLQFFLQKLAVFARKNGAGVVKIALGENLGEVDSVASEAEREQLAQKKTAGLREVFASCGFKHQGFDLALGATLNPRFNAVVYPPETLNGQSMTDDIAAAVLASLPRRTRQLINKAQKREVKVVKAGAERLDDFVNLLAKTEIRKGISLRSKEYLARFFRAFGSGVTLYFGQIDLVAAAEKYRKLAADAQAEISLLEEKSYKRRAKLEQDLASYRINAEFYQNRQALDGSVVTVAATMAVSSAGITELFYGGMNGDYAKIPAQYLVDYQVIVDQFTQGAKEVSFGGIDGHLGTCPLWEYKAKFGSQAIEEIGEFNYVCSHLVNFALRVAVPLVKKLRHGIKKITRKS